MPHYSTSQYHPRSRYAIYRDEQRGGPPRRLKPCGTYPAAMRHKRYGEDLDPACAQALADHQHQMYLKRKAKKAS